MEYVEKVFPLVCSDNSEKCSGRLFWNVLFYIDERDQLSGDWTTKSAGTEAFSATRSAG